MKDAVHIYSSQSVSLLYFYCLYTVFDVFLKQRVRQLKQNKQGDFNVFAVTGPGDLSILRVCISVYGREDVIVLRLTQIFFNATLGNEWEMCFEHMP